MIRLRVHGCRFIAGIVTEEQQKEERYQSIERVNYEWGHGRCYSCEFIQCGDKNLVKNSCSRLITGDLWKLVACEVVYVYAAGEKQNGGPQFLESVCEGKI